MISLIVCMGRNRVIGKDNKMPWHLPADLKYFKEMTMGHTVVMGRKTFESIGKVLPGRTNVVLTSDKNYQLQDVEIAHSIVEILQREEDIFIIGGANIYRQFLPYADRLYVTMIEEEFEGDAFFPEIDEHWQIVERSEGLRDAENPYDYAFLVYEK